MPSGHSTNENLAAPRSLAICTRSSSPTLSWSPHQTKPFARRPPLRPERSLERQRQRTSRGRGKDQVGRHAGLDQRQHVHLALYDIDLVQWTGEHGLKIPERLRRPLLLGERLLLLDRAVPLHPSGYWKKTALDFRLISGKYTVPAATGSVSHAPTCHMPRLSLSHDAPSAFILCGESRKSAVVTFEQESSSIIRKPHGNCFDVLVGAFPLVGAPRTFVAAGSVRTGPAEHVPVILHVVHGLAAERLCRIFSFCRQADSEAMAALRFLALALFLCTDQWHVSIANDIGDLSRPPVVRSLHQIDN